MINEAENRAEYFLDLFLKEGDDLLVASYPIRGMDLGAMQELFGTSPEDIFCDYHPVSQSHVKRLQEATGEVIDLSKFVAFAVSHASPE